MNQDQALKKGILVIEPDETQHALIRQELERLFPNYVHRFLFGMWAINMKNIDPNTAVVTFRPTPEVTDRLLPIAINDLRTAYPNTKLLLITTSRAADHLQVLRHNETTIDQLMRDIGSLIA